MIYFCDQIHFMPNLDQAKKALRKSKKAFLRNEAVRENLRKLKKSIRLAEVAKDAKKLAELSVSFQKTLDKAAKRLIIHKNKASRLKSRLMKKARA